MPILSPGLAVGSGFQLFIQSNGSSAVYADAAARDTYFGGNAADLARLDANQFLIIKLLDDGAAAVAFQQRSNSAFLDVTSLVQGETGPAGPTGNSYFFPSITARDAFFDTAGNEALLESGLPVVVNTGAAIASTFIWGGTTAPGIHDSTLWRVASLESSAGRLFLGQGGASIGSGNEFLNFRSPAGAKHYINGVDYDDTGSELPSFWDLAARSTRVVTDVFNSVLSSPNDFTVTALSDEMVVSFNIRPATTGSLRVQFWLGTDDTGPVVVDTTTTIVGGDIGNIVKVIAPNDVFIDVGTLFFARFTGVDLFGGLQTIDPYDGQTTVFINADLQLGTKKNLLTSDDQPLNVVLVNSEEDFGTVVVGVRIDVLADTTFVLQRPITQTLPFFLPTNSATQILTTNRNINTLTYTHVSAAQFQGTDASLALFDVSLFGNSTATAFDLNGGVLSLKFPDFNRYSGAGIVQNLVDLFSPGVFYDMIDSGLTMVNCATHTFQGCLILALSGNVMTFFNISGANAGDAQIVDNIYDNDAFGSFINVDGATYPAGKTVTVARNLVSTPANFFDGSSIDETDLRMFINGNKGQKDSRVIGDWAVNGNAVETVISLPDTFQDIVVTGATLGTLSERFTLTDAASGELTYIGLDPFNGFIISSIAGFKSGATAKYTFTLEVDGSIPAGAPESSFEIKTELGNKTLLGSVSLVTGDTIKLQVKGVGTSANLTIEEVSFDIRM